MTVEERVINVTLTAAPPNPAVNTVVQFTATASGTNIVSYNWNLGDGDTRVTTGPTTSKVYGSRRPSPRHPGSGECGRPARRSVHRNRRAVGAAA